MLRLPSPGDRERYRLRHEAIAQTIQRPGKDWSRQEIEDVFQWIVQAHLYRLTQFAYAVLKTYDPNTRLEDAHNVVWDKIPDAFRFLPQFDPTQSSFVHWLYVLVRRHCFKICRNASARLAIRDEEGNVLRDEEGNVLRYKMVSLEIRDKEDNVTPRPLPNPSASLDRWELSRDVWQEINRLSEPYRSALIMQHFQEMSYEKIAQVQECSYTNAKQRVHQAKCKLKALLGRGEKE